MENLFFEHIEFLLPKHKCVIVPSFGGFIINSENSTCDKNGKLSSPSYTIIFNQELKHDDGLLTASVQAVKNTSYATAASIVNDWIKDIKNVLQQGNSVICGKIGILKQDAAGNIIFHSNNTILYPSTMGLTPVSLQLIDSISQLDNTNKKRSLIIKRIGSVAAIVAGLFLFVTPSVNIGVMDKNIQKANFLDIFSQSVMEVNASKEIELDSRANVTGIQTEENEVTSDTSFSKPQRTYYIIIGGEESVNQANKLLEKFQSQDFPKADIVKSDRYRIYVASFFDKNEAERYLDLFRLENPKYATAWLYSKKNN